MTNGWQAFYRKRRGNAFPQESTDTYETSFRTQRPSQSKSNIGNHLFGLKFKKLQTWKPAGAELDRGAEPVQPRYPAELILRRAPDRGLLAGLVRSRVCGERRGK